MKEQRSRRAAVGAWVTYDVANTVFWTGVVGVSFPLWLTKDLRGDDATLGYTLAAAMFVVLVTAPILGAISDHANRRMPLLVATTLLCVASTLVLGTGGFVVTLSIFALALASMELGTIFYNALLVEVSTESNRGKISGMGTGIGYVGAFIAVGVAAIFSDSRGYVFVIHVVALLFLLFSLPIFFLLKEAPRPVPASTAWDKVIEGFSQLRRNLRNLDQFPGLRQFLLARLLYCMGINTAVAFAVVYASQTVGLSDREIQLVLLAGISVAVPSGVIWGTMVDRLGPKPVLTAALSIWIVLLLIAVGMAWLSLTSHLWWLVGCLTGVAMAGGWTADRPYMLSLTPHQYLGEFFGLHGMVGKLGRVAGPFLWALISSTLGLGQPMALLGLMGCLVISCAVLNMVTVRVSYPAADLVE